MILSILAPSRALDAQDGGQHHHKIAVGHPQITCGEPSGSASQHAYASTGSIWRWRDRLTHSHDHPKGNDPVTPETIKWRKKRRRASAKSTLRTMLSCSRHIPGAAPP